MQISSTPTAYGGGEAQRLLGMLLQQRGTAAGQDLPGADDAPAPAPAAAQPAGGLGAAQFASKTLSSLLSTQEAPPSSSHIAGKVIGAADTNGDGSLSLEEVEKALGQDTTSGADAPQDALGQAFAKVDTDGDGQISDSELTSALDARKAAGGAQHAHHGHHAHHAAASSTDLASQMLTDLDSDGDGALSASEIQAGLKQGSGDALASALGSLDTDGDGKLSASELSSAIEAFRTAHHHGGANAAAQTTQAVTA